MPPRQTVHPRLAWPEQWATPVAFGWCIIGFFWIFALIALGAVFTDSTNSGAARLLSPMAVLSGVFFALAAAGYVTMVRHRRWTTRALRPAHVDGSGTAGVSISYGRAAPALLAAGIAVSAAVGVALLGFHTHDGGAVLRFDIVPVLGILALVGCGYIVLMMARFRGSRWALILRPDDVTVSFGRFEVTAAWSSVMMVYPAGISNAPATMGIAVAFWEGTSPLCLRRRTWRGRLVAWRGARAANGLLLPTLIRPVWLGLDPVLTLRTLTFYLDHPHLRNELGTPESIRRIRAGDVVGTP